MKNIYFLEGQAVNFEADHPAVIGNDRDGVLVECSLSTASVLARAWNLKAPMLAKDGVHTSESGDVVFIANGKQVIDVEIVAEALDWLGMEECGLDAIDFLHHKNRVF